MSSHVERWENRDEITRLLETMKVRVQNESQQISHPIPLSFEQH